MADLLVRRSLIDGLGPIAPPVRRRLRAVLEPPMQDTWDAAYAIMLRSGLILWQAVKAVDPNFPGTKLAGRGGRSRVPDQLTLARALRWARS
jgi:hypothetical protein